MKIKIRPIVPFTNKSATGKIINFENEIEKFIECVSKSKSKFEIVQTSSPNNKTNKLVLRPKKLIEIFKFLKDNNSFYSNISIENFKYEHDFVNNLKLQKLFKESEAIFSQSNF